jgi:fumarylpyruvate hydrolase
MTSYVFSPRPPVSVAIEGSQDRFPVHRIYCVGRNYADHAREMGVDTGRESPVFFTKPADAIVASGGIVPYPPRTTNLHHEIELVVALKGGGREVPADAALQYVFGYAAGNDFTRRDLQQASRAAGQPWDTGKAFDHSAGIGPIKPASQPVTSGRIWLTVNGRPRQDANLSDMIWSVPEIIAELSTLFELTAGDLIYTGTPAGVGALRKGDRIEGGIEGVGTIAHIIE